MKREEKNQLTRRKILDSALEEFSTQGYGASSMNHICGSEGISKGIIYHYFDTKDALFLACVDECFRLLTDFIRAEVRLGEDDMERELKAYFDARLNFFRKNPVYRRIFCEAVIMPPAHLKEQIQKRKQGFDELNTEILGKLLEPVSLRRDITKAEVIELFHQFQVFINAHYQWTDSGSREFENREEVCRKAMNILLYGVIERKELKNV